MKDHDDAPRRGLFGRPVLTVTVALAALIGAGLGGVALANRDGDPGTPVWRQPGESTRPVASSGRPAATPRPSGTARREAGRTSAAPDRATVTLSATGDIIMGSAPDKLPARGGDGFFDSVEQALAADLVMGNLEQPLTGDTGTSKCGTPPRDNCFAFRAPPSYARHLEDAGFDLLNTANNHARDYGAAGYRNTRRALDDAGLKYTGSTGEITVVPVEGVDVAVVGFSSYAGANSLIDLTQARRVVQQAAERADLVVVQVHMGAEGADKAHVAPGTETFFGENRGDPMAFGRAVIDAGADLVVGHGPHVLRGMEFYRDRLIAYSLGNFAGGGRTLSSKGDLKYSGVLKVWAGGEFLSTALDATGRPVRDSARERGRALVAQLSTADFGAAAARFGPDGAISPPA
jgi:hypothetical protein